MRRLRLLIPLALGIALLAAGCGGKKGVPSDSVALVGSQKVTQASFDSVVKQARAAYKLQKRTFPKDGSPDFLTLENQIVAFLVERVEFEEKAAQLGITVTPKEIDARLDQIRKQYFGGDDKKLQAALASQGRNEPGLRDDVLAQLLSEKLFKKVTADAKVTDQDVTAYYNAHKDLYGQPESRTVRHILVKQRALAFQIFHQLQKGASFPALAKKYSIDTGSKATGGKLTITKGQTVPQFDRVAFSIGTNTISPPVQTQFGWHVIQALTPVKPAVTTPLAKVSSQIRQQLLQTKQNQEMTAWVAGVKKEFASKVSYAKGFLPPATTPATTAQATTTG
jgi:foldase protein PrsA